MEVGTAGSKLPVTQHPPGRAGRMVGARCRAAGRAEAALPGDPRWTAHPPMSPEPPSWPRTKHRALCTVRKGGGTLTILLGCGNQAATGLTPSRGHWGRSWPVPRFWSLSQGLLARVSRHSLSRPPRESRSRAPGPAHMLPFPATFLSHLGATV